jgi:hypothetical protein
VAESFVATHEVGHAVAARMLGRAVHMVTILPTERHEGMTILGGGEAHPTDRANLCCRPSFGQHRSSLLRDSP